MPDDVIAASATLEVLAPPTVDELYFWALQVSFEGRQGRTGGAHLGLQHHPGYPNGTAANWGGYDDVVGGELSGTESALPSALGNANTRTFRWAAKRQYRLEVSQSASGWWQGAVTDVEAGALTVIRELNGRDAVRLSGLMVWSEVFAPCDAPGVAVRWTDLAYKTREGRRDAPLGLEANYQAAAAGGCANTNSTVDAGAARQETNTSRTTPQGQYLAWSSPKS